MQIEASLPPGEMLRQVMRHWATGVAVVTSAHEEMKHGMTVNSFVSVSLDPPLVTVTMNNDTRTLNLVQQSGVFAITILSRFQQQTAERFAGRGQDADDRMSGLEIFTLTTGAPLLLGGAAFLDCRVVQQVKLQHSTLLIGEVLAAHPAQEAVPPLVYINRSFTSLPEIEIMANLNTGGSMAEDNLTQEERCQLLQFARRSIEMSVRGETYWPMDLINTLSPRLRELGTCFVTLTLPGGELRGCIGGLKAVQSLALDVCEHAAAAAMNDYRFLPVQAAELPRIKIEISRLTSPQPLLYDDPASLPDLLHPNVDGVVLYDGSHRATFLPQVWEKIPDPCQFLSQLCIKMGASGSLWKKKKLMVEIYRVEEFHEAD